MFAWAPLPPAFREIGSMQFATLMVEKSGVVVSPGVAFGEQGSDARDRLGAAIEHAVQVETEEHGEMVDQEWKLLVRAERVLVDGGVLQAVAARHRVAACTGRDRWEVEKAEELLGELHRFGGQLDFLVRHVLCAAHAGGGQSGAGAPCAADVKRAMLDWLGPIIWESYGSTETFTISAAYPCGSPEELWKGCNGGALPGNTIKIVYKGKVSGDEIKFTRTIEGREMPPVEFTAKRAK